MANEIKPQFNWLTLIKYVVTWLLGCLSGGAGSSLIG